MPCHVLGLTHSVNILEEDTVEIMMSAVAYPLMPLQRNVIPFPRQKGLRLKHRGPEGFSGDPPWSCPYILKQPSCTIFPYLS